MPRPLAYGKELAARRRNGDRIGLLVVSVHDWEAGKWFEGRSGVARVVLPADIPVADADWSVAMALDVLVCGDAPDECFYGVCSALERAGAASIWGEFETGILLLERIGKGAWVTRLGGPFDGPYMPGQMAAMLRRYREVMMLLRSGFYGSRIFDGARQAILQSMREVRA